MSEPPLCIEWKSKEDKCEGKKLTIKASLIILAFEKLVGREIIQALIFGSFYQEKEQEQMLQIMPILT